ncbi:putative hemolysin [Stenotrophomonas maltophilia]|nr:DUF333 domain-containing protein [Stenotrophomonas maltophilia]
MKNVGLTLSSALAMTALVACSSPADKEPAPIGMANPAALHCEKNGGKSVIEKNPDGSEYGVCHLGDGTQVDEWELYRRDNPQAGASK